MLRVPVCLLYSLISQAVRLTVSSALWLVVEMHSNAGLFAFVQVAAFSMEVVLHGMKKEVWVLRGLG